MNKEFFYVYSEAVGAIIYVTDNQELAEGKALIWAINTGRTTEILTMDQIQIHRDNQSVREHHDFSGLSTIVR